MRIGRDVTIHAYVMVRGYSKVYVYSLVIQSDYEEEFNYTKCV